MHKGLLIVLSGPSGVGKGTVCAALRKKMTNLVYSISATTRSPRKGEQDSVNYFFKSKQEFEDMIGRGEMLEWAKYVDNYYGTPAKFVEETTESGKDIILEIDVKGAMQVKEKCPNGVFIFLVPPSLNELRSRIENRGTENEATIQSRMVVAKEEINRLKSYDYVVVNDQIELASSRIESIIEAEHCKRERVFPDIEKAAIEAFQVD
ncbi:guanylate kinase [Longirhabdus pacifica]|uniref:guanylate kinase n=1 Tax=Longirhabdus pacifica TaxID=2305227 RepID=UPI001008A6FD|nr:guanylate kinase [Longirhabdus pacifica]